MELVPLNPKLIDVIKLQAKTNSLPVLLGLGLAFYFDHIKLDTLAIIIPALIAMYAFVIFISCKTNVGSLTKEGISHLDWRGRSVICKWSQGIEINAKIAKMSGYYSIKDIERNITFSIAKVVFSYPEVREFIMQHAPKNHPFRELVNNGS